RAGSSRFPGLTSRPVLLRHWCCPWACLSWTPVSLPEPLRMKIATTPYEVETAGNPASPVLFFTHGWPDNASLWRKQLAELSGEFYCVAVNLPNFGAVQRKAGGYDFPELVEGLAATIRQHQ